eukprot:GFYU01006436.1.p1 GENE.GFYU01006436.1~~GFYU01006436.1.p1  ORF type:complete len:1089 (-),score=289.92 GFYU01006436.1:166-3432(-)
MSRHSSESDDSFIQSQLQSASEKSEVILNAFDFPDTISKHAKALLVEHIQQREKHTTADTDNDVTTSRTDVTEDATKMNEVDIYSTHPASAILRNLRQTKFRVNETLKDYDAGEHGEDFESQFSRLKFQVSEMIKSHEANIYEKEELFTELEKFGEEGGERQVLARLESVLSELSEQAEGDDGTVGVGDATFEEFSAHLREYQESRSKLSSVHDHLVEHLKDSTEQAKEAKMKLVQSLAETELLEKELKNVSGSLDEKKAELQRTLAEVARWEREYDAAMKLVEAHAGRVRELEEEIVAKDQHTLLLEKQLKTALEKAKEAKQGAYYQRGSLAELRKQELDVVVMSRDAIRHDYDELKGMLGDYMSAKGESESDVAAVLSREPTEIARHLNRILEEQGQSVENGHVTIHQSADRVIAEHASKMNRVAKGKLAQDKMNRMVTEHTVAVAHYQSRFEEGLDKLQELIEARTHAAITGGDVKGIDHLIEEVWKTSPGQQGFLRANDAVSAEDPYVRIATLEKQLEAVLHTQVRQKHEAKKHEDAIKAAATAKLKTAKAAKKKQEKLVPANRFETTPKSPRRVSDSSSGSLEHSTSSVTKKKKTGSKQKLQQLHQDHNEYPHAERESDASPAPAAEDPVGQTNPTITERSASGDSLVSSVGTAEVDQQAFKVGVEAAKVELTGVKSALRILKQQWEYETMEFIETIQDASAQLGSVDATASHEQAREFPPLHEEIRMKVNQYTRKFDPTRPPLPPDQRAQVEQTEEDVSMLLKILTDYEKAFEIMIKKQASPEAPQLKAVSTDAFVVDPTTSGQSSGTESASDVSPVTPVPPPALLRNPLDNSRKSIPHGGIPSPEPVGINKPGRSLYDKDLSQSLYRQNSSTLAESPGPMNSAKNPHPAAGLPGKPRIRRLSSETSASPTFSNFNDVPKNEKEFLDMNRTRKKKLPKSALKKRASSVDLSSPTNVDDFLPSPNPQVSKSMQRKASFGGKSAGQGLARKASLGDMVTHHVQDIDAQDPNVRFNIVNKETEARKLMAQMESNGNGYSLRSSPSQELLKKQGSLKSNMKKNEMRKQQLAALNQQSAGRPNLPSL